MKIEKQMYLGLLMEDVSVKGMLEEGVVARRMWRENIRFGELLTVRPKKRRKVRGKKRRVLKDWTRVAAFR